MSTQQKTPANVLRAARKLIEKPEDWCQGAYNKNSSGYEFVPRDEAVRWCAEGAILHVCDTFDVRNAEAADALEAIHNIVGYIPEWNDAAERTHSEVLEAFDRAIALAERTRAAGGVG